MNNYSEECLITLGEECAEVIQAISKILRFGFTSWHPNDPTTNNLEHLQIEIGDLVCMIDLLKEEGVINDHAIQNARLQKRIKFKKFSTYKPTLKEIKE